MIQTLGPFFFGDKYIILWLSSLNIPLLIWFFFCRVYLIRLFGQCSDPLVTAKRKQLSRQEQIYLQELGSRQCLTACNVKMHVVLIVVNCPTMFFVCLQLLSQM